MRLSWLIASKRRSPRDDPHGDQEPDLYDEPPQQWFECEACGGEGQVFDRMSGSVSSGSIDPPFEVYVTCGKCGGAGGFLDEARDDAEDKYCPYRHFTEEEEKAWEAVFAGVRSD